jgi:hypothetical protein
VLLTAAPLAHRTGRGWSRGRLFGRGGDRRKEPYVWIAERTDHQSSVKESVELLAACPAEDGAPVAGGAPIADVGASAPAQDSLGYAELAADWAGKFGEIIRKLRDAGRLWAGRRLGFCRQEMPCQPE